VVKKRPGLIGLLEAVAGVALICAGVAWIWGVPWALLVAGGFVLFDRLT